MELTTANAYSSCATMCNADRSLSDPHRVIHQATVDVGKNTLLFETALFEPANMTKMETAPSFMERVTATHRDKKANEDIDGTVARSDSSTTE